MTNHIGERSTRSLARARAVRPALLATLLALAAATGTAADLWSHAVGVYEANRELLPGRMTISFDQYNGRGSLVSSETSELLLSVDDEGEVTSFVVSATKDGRDVTEARRSNPSSGAPFGGGGGGDSDDDNGFAGLQKSPFDPLEQPNVTFVDTGIVESVGGARSRIHEFVLRTGEKSRTTGRAWLADDGPVKVEATVEPLPPFVETFQVVQRFTADRAGRWYLSEMVFTAEGSFLFIRRRIESVFRFSDYFAP